MSVFIKRIYDDPSSEDGERYLVDRLWPRGITKAKAAVEGWIKDIAPSSELRKWFGHKPERWKEFSKRYRLELGKQDECVDWLVEKTKHHKVTLVYAARDKKINHAVVLRKYLLQRSDTARY